MKRILLALVVLALVMVPVSAITMYNSTVDGYNVTIINGTAGTIQWDFTNVNIIDCLIIGGGGSSGNGQGGTFGNAMGGAGGVLNGSLNGYVKGIYNLTVGARGEAESTLNTHGRVGGNSSISNNSVSWTAYGGGYGGAGSVAGQMIGGPGGSGGGGYNGQVNGTAIQTSQTPLTGYGFAGGTIGGGKGGGGGAGGAASGATRGPAKSFNITGTPTDYAKGGQADLASTQVRDGFGDGGDDIAGENSLRGGNGTIILKYTITAPVENPISANFTQSPNPSSTGQSVSFTDTSDGTVVTRNWTFNNNGTPFNDRNASPSYTWNSTGTFDVFLNVTNTTGAMSNISYAHTVTNASVLYPQDIWMEGAYVQTFFVHNSGDVGIGNTTITTGNYSATTASNGYANLTLPFGSYLTTFTVSGYTTKQVSYVVDSDATHDVEMATAVGGSTEVALAGTPKDVKFHIQSFLGAPITTATVRIQGISTTTGNWDWLASLLSIDLGETPINSTAMNGTTDSNGDIVFLMLDTVKYNISVTASGYTFPVTYISPQASQYTINAVMNQTWFATGNDTLKEVNVSVSWVTINATHSFINISYNDQTAKTTGGTINVYRDLTGRQANATYITSMAIIGATCNNSTIITTPPGGVSYRVVVNGTTTGGQNIIRTFTHFFKGSPVTLPGWTPETQLWLALFIVVFTAAFAGATHSPQMAVVLCVESWIFWAIGWLDALISVFGYGEASIISILIIASFVTVWWNVAEGKAKGKRSS